MLLYLFLCTYVTNCNKDILIKRHTCVHSYSISQQAANTRGPNMSVVYTLYLITDGLGIAAAP